MCDFVIGMLFVHCGVINNLSKKKYKIYEMVFEKMVSG